MIATAARKAGQSGWLPEPACLSGLVRERLAALRVACDGKKPGAA